MSEALWGGIGDEEGDDRKVEKRQDDRVGGRWKEVVYYSIRVLGRCHISLRYASFRKYSATLSDPPGIPKLRTSLTRR